MLTAPKKFCDIHNVKEAVQTTRLLFESFV